MSDESARVVPIRKGSASRAPLPPSVFRTQIVMSMRDIVDERKENRRNPCMGDDATSGQTLCR
jgi:hypothetical protein